MPSLDSDTRSTEPAAPSYDAGGGDTGQPTRTRGQRRVTVELWIILALLAFGAATRWIDSPTPGWLPIVQVLGSALAPPAIIAAGAAWSRRWRLTVAAAALALVQLASAVPTWSAGDHAVDGAAEDALVVMVSNLKYGQGDVGTVTAAVADLDVDVLMLLEATGDALGALDGAGLAERLPHTVTRPRKDAGGALIFSRYPLSTTDVPPVPPTFFETPAVRVSSPQGNVLMLAAHPVPPMPGQTTIWYTELRALTSWAAALPEDVPLVMAGDFNATSAHPVFRRFHSVGLYDAHREVGAGPVTTWPQFNLALPLPKWFHLDHVLARGLSVAEAGVVTIPGSDHDAAWAELLPRHN